MITVTRKEFDNTFRTKESQKRVMLTRPDESCVSLRDCECGEYYLHAMNFGRIAFWRVDDVVGQPLTLLKIITVSYIVFRQELSTHGGEIENILKMYKEGMKVEEIASFYEL